MKATSLFSNVGISELFFKKHGVEVRVANELLLERANFYRSVFPSTNMIVGDITEKEIFNKIVAQSIEENIELLIATPPCQGMSIAGKQKSNDQRNKLIIPVVDFIKKVKPRHVIIENVPSLLKFSIEVNGELKKIINYVEDELKPLGYRVLADVLDSADYGTPQHRKRAILILTLSENVGFPKKSKNFITVRDAIGNLDSLESGEKSTTKWHYAKKHNDRHVLWMKNTPTGKTAHDNKKNYPQIDGRRIKGYKTTYKRIEWDKPSPTITMANGSISSQNNVHPGRMLKDGTYSDARTLTILELMRLMGIPDNWKIPDWASDNLIRKVIGEGFPPKFSESIIKEIIKNGK